MRGNQFERLVKWWVTQDPKTSLKIKNVWLWKEWPDYPGRDIGIDLVAELIDGSLCAIQAKCFDENRDIPKSELDSFISAASQHTFQHRWLIATTDKLSSNARRMLDDQHVVRILRSDLEASLDSWPTSIDELNPILQPKSTPRPHQDLAIREVVAGLEDNDRGQLIMACGTGKTLTSLWIKETIQPKTTLVLVPSLNLLAQTLAEWAKNMSTPWNYLCVCSDDTVNKADDQPISTVGDLPFDVTTSSEQIASFLQLGGEKIIFSTYQSSAQVAKAQANSGASFDLVICDEAHRLTGKTDPGYATVLDEKKIVAEKRLFMTATPRTYTAAAKTKAEDRGVEITSMDDERIYGPVLHKLSFGEAIKQELLSDYRVLIVGVTDPQVQDLIDRRELVSVNDAVTTDARTLANHIGLAKATKDFNLKRTISFHSRIKTADQFARDHVAILNWLPESHKPSGETWAGTISGAMNTGDRRKLLNQLRLDGQDRHAILTNARCLTEGVDVPSLDGVAFIDPRSSQVDIIQAIGRAIRKSENKEIGTIVLPVLIQTDTDIESALEDSAFKPIWAILNALKSHDEDFAIELSQLRTELGRTGKLGPLPSRIIEDLPSDIDSLLPNFVSQFSISIIENSTSVWDFWLGLLKAYQTEHGSCEVPAKFLYNGLRLGQWVNSQRTKYKNGLLLADRVFQLEQIESWSWNQLEDIWNSNFNLLEKYVVEFGHSQVPYEPALYHGEKLFAWCQMQRGRYNKGRLELVRITKLESLPGWTWTPKEDSWDEWFLILKSYEQTHGNCRVPQGFMVGERNLGRWVSKQRARYKKGALEISREARLQELKGWTWDPHNEFWETAFNSLVRFAAEHGHANPVQTFKVNEFQLGAWVSAQRTTHHKGKLERERIKRLEELPGWTWDPISESWTKMFEALTKYSREHGVARPPKAFNLDGLELGAWVSAQRVRFNKGKLESDRASKLQSLPGWTWDQSSDSWEEFFSSLVRYAGEFGAATPAQSSIYEGVKLGTWVNGQRQKFKKGALDLEQTKRLENLPGWSWDPLNESWDTSYSQLLNFAKKFGHVSVPDEPSVDVQNNLTAWIRRQRGNYKNGRLDAEKIAKLELLPNWSWKPHSDSWSSYFSLLEEFTSEYGHPNVLQGKKKMSYKGYDLGGWINTQRTQFKAGRLGMERIELLESLGGWTWDPLADSWESFFSLLQEFVLENGHALVPQGTAKQLYKGHDLSRWVNKQRTNFKHGRLNEERFRRLEEVEGWSWDPFSDVWDSTFNILKIFEDEHGHVSVPRNPTKYRGVGLATWITSQRSKFRDGQLSQERIEKLESISSWKWNLNGDEWDLSFSILEKYVAEFGQATPIQTCVYDGVKIGTWITSQRAKYKRNELENSKVAKLETLPGWSWQPLEDEWNLYFNHLVEFQKEFGHTLVPREPSKFRGMTLASWTTAQRSRFSKGLLEEERIKKLESLQSWSWDPRSDLWEQQFAALVEYMNQFGTADPPQTYVARDLALGNWVGTQRIKHRKNQLSAERTKRLENLNGWSWAKRKSPRIN